MEVFSFEKYLKHNPNGQLNSVISKLDGCPVLGHKVISDFGIMFFINPKLDLTVEAEINDPRFVVRKEEPNC